MANQVLAKRKREPEDDEDNHKVWRNLPPQLVEKCLGFLPVLTIASKLRGLNKAWRDYPGTLPFMKWHNHGKNLNSSFGFLMYGMNPFNSTGTIETMTIDPEALKWQMAPSLQLHGDHSTCRVESVSEGLLLLRFGAGTSRRFIVWNPLLGCTQAVPGISRFYTNLNLVVDRATGTFKIVAFSAWYRECLTYSSTTGSWQSVVNYEAPVVDGLSFPIERGYRGGHTYKCDHNIAIAYKNCVYVAVKCCDLEVGDLCYDVERNVWKPAVMCSVPQATMELYGFCACFTRSLFVVNDVMYKVVVYESRECRDDVDRPHPTVQISARSLAAENNGGAWAVIASTMLPHNEWITKWVGSWYACTLKGHEKPTICGLFMTNVGIGPLYMIMYDVGTFTWKDLISVRTVADVADCVRSEEDVHDKMYNPILNLKNYWSSNERKWMDMRMVPHYTPSWICPAADCTHHETPRHPSMAHVRAHVGAL